MTREDSEDDRRESSETRTATAGSRERSDSAKSSSAEQSDPRDAEEIPFTITGHEERKREREAAAEADEEPGEDDGLISDFSADEFDTDDDEVEPVELLVTLADDGDIDPWDIDIVAVTDAFLERLDEADLRTGGRALFYASVLLRMKSDHLLEEDEPEFEEEAWDAALDDPRFDGPAVDPFDKLEAEMERRLERKRARGMPQTLDQLVRELRERERELRWKAHREYDTSNSPHGYSRGTQTLSYHSADDFRLDDEPTAHDVIGTAHDEHMEDVIAEVYMRLREHYDKGRAEVLFAELTAGDDTHAKVETFLALLFLAHRSQIRLQQDDLFGDLWVQDPAAVPQGEEATAD